MYTRYIYIYSITLEKWLIVRVKGVNLDHLILREWSRLTQVMDILFIHSASQTKATTPYGAKKPMGNPQEYLISQPTLTNHKLASNIKDSPKLTSTSKIPHFTSPNFKSIENLANLWYNKVG